MKKKMISSVKSPHVFVLLFTLVFLASILTYIVPAGEFVRVEDTITAQNIVVPGSYHLTESSSVAPWLIPIKFFETLTNAKISKLIFFIFLIGGAFEVIMQSGCIASICKRMIAIFEKRGILIVPVFILFFSVFGFSMGLTTASTVFVPIGIALARALGFDDLTGAAMVMLGTNAGFAAGIYNPFSVGIAQSLAEVPMFSGAWIRWLLLVALLVLTSLYIMKYANTSKSLINIKGTEQKALWETVQNTESDSNTIKQVLVLCLFAITLCIITFGVSNLDWGIQEIAVSFFILGIIAGLLSGFGANKTCEIYLSGCKKMMKGAFIIGIAATMRTVLFEGGILDTVAYHLMDVVNELPSWAQLLGMFYANAAIDPIITSGSAHAAVVVPIMVPMADAMQLSRQSAVFAFQLGDGLVNLISPISTTLTSCLAVSGISYGKWLRFFLPLVGIYMIVGTGFIVLASLTGY
ncbi:MAG: C4-dicarboxylate ABC transporter permease [Anaerovorax sp.]|nr:C4-dicarboxylate ABC transporter permease [Anaerovorax sp.]